MNHHKSGRIILGIKRNRIDKPWLIAFRTKPPDFRARWTRTYINLFLNIRSPEIQAKFIFKVPNPTFSRLRICKGTKIANIWILRILLRQLGFIVSKIVRVSREKWLLLDKREKTLLGGDDVIGGGGDPTENRGPQRTFFSCCSCSGSHLGVPDFFRHFWPANSKRVHTIFNFGDFHALVLYIQQRSTSPRATGHNEWLWVRSTLFFHGQHPFFFFFFLM